MVLRKLPRGYKVYLPLVLTLVFFVFMLPRSPRFGYEYKKGEYWMYETLIAEFDFPILKTSSELQSEKDSVKQVKIPYFDRKVEVVKTIEDRLTSISSPSTESAVSMLRDSVIANIYAKGVFSPGDAGHYQNVPKDAVCAVLHNDFEDEKVLVNEIYTVDRAREYMKTALADAGYNGDSLYTVLGLNELIIPDLEYNSVITDERYSDRLLHPS